MSLLNELLAVTLGCLFFFTHRYVVWSVCLLVVVFSLLTFLQPACVVVVVFALTLLKQYWLSV